ncbi:MAG: hypothetical protein AXA67_02540 [Methylothermaceae bacteria B42]|nr:MAG: hypothetical protein AXA67_02540 [Methylothermaceae bacteria B42]
MTPEKIKAGFPGLDLLQHFSQLPFFRLAVGGGGFFMHPTFAQDRGAGLRNPWLSFRPEGEILTHQHSF